MPVLMRQSGSPGRIQPAQTQIFRQKNATEFLLWADCFFFYFIVYNNPTLNPLTIAFTSQKQHSGSAIKKTCFESMQQIYRRAPMSKCDFNKTAFGKRVLL